MKTKLKGISRIDSKNTHGWYVRIYANGGVFVSKLFSDRLHGGKQQALKDATAFRNHNQMVADLSKQQLKGKNKKPFYEKPPKNNTSGIVGVNEIKTKAGGKNVHYFQATWSENGKAKSKKFYVTATRSLNEARQEAVEYRRQREKELETEWSGQQE